MKEKGKIKILGLTSDGGSRFHRVELPLSYLRGKEIEINGEKVVIQVDFISKERTKYGFTPEEMENYDIVYFNWAIVNNEAWMGVHAEKFGTKIIQDVDDYWVYPDNHIQKKVENSNKVARQIANADVVVCSTERLASHIGQFTDIVSVSPNFLPIGEGQFSSKEGDKNTSGKMRIGICGSISHINDWMSIKSIIRKIANDSYIHKNAEFVICGAVEGSKMWNKVINLFKCNPAMNVRVNYAKDVSDYMSLYDDIDVLLAPLEDNEFNACKSNLKIAEAMCKGIPVIGSPLFAQNELSAYCAAMKPLDYYNWVKYFLKEKNWVEKGKELANDNIKSNDFPTRIENLTKLVKALAEGIIPVKTENSKIFGITYDEGQYTEYSHYDNSHIRTPEQKSWRFEYNAIIDIVDNQVGDLKEDDYLGIFSYKFPNKTGLSKTIVNKIIRQNVSNNIDIFGFSPSYYRGNYFAFSELQHPGLLSILSKVCDKLGLKMPQEPSKVVYSNFFIAKKSIYTKYVNEIVKPALEILEGKLWQEVDKDASYKSGVNAEKLKALTGLDYYNFVTFVLERMFSVWVENNPDYKFLQIG